MVKNQKRSNRESKKPKQSKPAFAVKPSALESLMPKVAPNFSRGSKTPLKGK